jgi:hypothetical protein
VVSPPPGDPLEARTTATPSPARPFVADQTPISTLTTMKHEEWRLCIVEVGRDQPPYLNESIILLDGILHGVNVGFEGSRTPRPDAPNLRVSEVDMPKIDAVINADVLARKKAGPFDTKPPGMIFISPIGCVPKRGTTKVRVIHHLSHPFKGDSVNGGIHEDPLLLGSFDEAIRAILATGVGCFLIKMDVDAAYKQVPVRPDDWPLLGFCWRGKYYYERVLPFGLKSSCRLWEYYARALHHFFTHILMIPCVVHYVDDFLFVVRPCTPDESPRPDALAREYLTAATGLTARLGINMADKKTEGPLTRLTFLGIELDTMAMTARLPADKLVRLRQLLVEWSQKSSASIKEFEELGGFLNWCCCVVKAGRPFTGRLYKLIATLKGVRGRPGATRASAYTISKAVREDIVWWATLVAQDACHWSGCSLIIDPSVWHGVEFFTDACGAGYGGHYGNEWFADTWPDDVLDAAQRNEKLAMPFLELYALVCAAHAWGARFAGKAVTFRTDCETAMYAVNKGASSEPGMAHLVRELALAAGRFGFMYRAVHIAGKLNKGADILSRHGFCAQYRAICPTALPYPTPQARLRLPLREGLILRPPIATRHTPYATPLERPTAQV